MTLSADMKDDADFFAKLLDRTYQLAVTHTPPEDANVFHAKKCGHEDLFLSLPTTSPLAFHPRLQLDHLKCLKEDLPKYRRLFDKVTEKTIA